MTKRKTWWEEHWDEVMLIGGIALGLYWLFKSMGIIG